MKNGDLVTREGLQAFADLCKDKFYSEQIVVNRNGVSPVYLSLSFGSLDSNVKDIKIVITGAKSILTVVSINIDNSDLSTIYNSGGVTVSEATYGVSDGEFFVKLKIDDTVNYVSVGCQAATNSKIFYIEPDISVNSSMESSLSNTIKANSVSGSGSGTTFQIKTDSNKYEPYASGKSFDTIYKAHQLDRSIKFVLTSNDSLVEADGYDFSKDTVYIKTDDTEQQLGNSFSGTDLDTVTVRDGLVVSGSTSSAATNIMLGKIKIGRTATATELPVELDEDNQAYVTLPASIFTYKGSVDTYDKLPEKARVGDVYTVKSGNDNEDTGSEYVYVEKSEEGSKTNYWEYLGQKVTFEQIQADWNVIDTTNKAYIKNKPVKQQLFKRKKLAADETLTLVSVFDITDGNNTPTVPIECEMLFYNSADSEVTVTPDSKWINMQSSDETITIPTGKYAEYVFTYWPKDGDEAAVVTYNGAVQP